MLLADLPTQCFDEQSLELCEVAANLANEAWHHTYDDVHVFAAILAQEEGFIPADILRMYGFDYEDVLEDVDDHYRLDFKVIPVSGPNLLNSVAHGLYFARQRHRTELMSPADLLGGIFKNRSLLIERAIARSGHRAQVVVDSLRLYETPVTYRS